MHASSWARSMHGDRLARFEHLLSGDRGWGQPDGSPALGRADGRLVGTQWIPKSCRDRMLGSGSGRFSPTRRSAANRDSPNLLDQPYLGRVASQLVGQHRARALRSIQVPVDSSQSGTRGNGDPLLVPRCDHSRRRLQHRSTDLATDRARRHRSRTHGLFDRGIGEAIAAGTQASDSRRYNARGRSDAFAVATVGFSVDSKRTRDGFGERSTCARGPLGDLSGRSRFNRSRQCRRLL